MDEVKTKGVTLVHLRQYVVERFGEEGLARVAAALPPAQAQLLQSPFAHEWYPNRDHAQIEAKVMEVLFGGISKARDFGYYDASLTVGFVYRVLLRVLDPGLLVKKSATLWKLMMSGGKCEVEVTSPTSCKVKLSGYDQHHEVLCYDWIGSFQGSLETCGAKQVQVAHPECRFHGAAHCLYEVRWQR
ncbi:MAG: DUF2378 family protein [Myxococcales bacterium]